MASKQQGFTIIELMIAVAVVAILASLAIPGIQSSLARSSINGPVKELKNALSLAKTTAVGRATNTYVCASVDQASCGDASDWNKGWIVFVDVTGSGTYVDGSDELVSGHNALHDNVTVTFSGTDASKVRFTRSGFATGNAGDFTFCRSDDPSPSTPVHARGLIVGASGVVVRSRDMDGDAVHETSGGNIACP